MFRRSKWKIVAAIMAALAVLLLGTLAVIYLSSYREVAATNRGMLDRYAQLYALELRPGKPPEEPGKPGLSAPFRRPEGPRFEDTPAFQLSTFYSVAVSKEDGSVLAVDNSDREIYTDAQLQDYALQIVASGSAGGSKERLLYAAVDKGSYTLVAFMDNTLMQDSMTTLFRYTLLFGSMAMVVLFFAALFLASRIVRPLEESYEKQKQFVSDAGHELKTPVSVISANADMLGREIGENPWLGNIQYENARMGALVTQLLELARTEQVAPEKTQVDLGRIVLGEALPFETVLFENGLRLQCDVAEGLPVLGNAPQLSQLVSILLDNAVRHSRAGGTVRVELRREKAHGVLSVTNEGTTIPEEQQKHLFDRFYRGDAARTGDENRYGLGLAIAKAIVTAHHGQISVASSNGITVFTAVLPAL